MATLTGRKIKDTYKDLLQISNSNAGIDGTLRTITDGEATTSVLQLSSSAVNIASAGALQYAGTAITATAAELNVLDGITATISSNTAELAAGIAGTSVGGFSNVDTDFSTLTSANASSTDAFGIAVGGLETFDLLDEPSGSVDQVDCIVLS